MMFAESLSPSSLLRPQVIDVLAASAVAWVVWTVIQGLYNVFLHPLAEYPGPRWAGFSVWWKINLEMFQGKDLVEELFKLHDIYGKIRFYITIVRHMLICAY